MKKQKILLSVVLALCVLCTTACGGEKKPANSESSQSKQKVETTYADQNKSPDYAAVSEDVKYTTYYFDSKAGNDENEGTSKNAPKQTLEAMNDLIVTIKGDNPVKILIKAGSEYTGLLKVQEFEAFDESPLIIDVYGKTDKNQYAKIIGEKDSACVTVGNSNVRVSGLEATGPTADRGIFLNPIAGGAMKNVVITGNYCHDLNFDVSGLENGLNSLPAVGTAPEMEMVTKICSTERYSYNKGGIIAEASTPEVLGASWFENLWIENNVIERVARTGIWCFSNWARRPGIDWGKNPYYSDEVNWFPHYNVIIRNNRINHAGGDSIVMGAVDGGWLEGNTSYYAQYLGRAGYFNAGIWTHSCKNVMFQYNEAAYTYLQNGAGDGQGFDIDIGNSNITVQYNYSHHNEGGGIMFCNLSTWIAQYDENGEYVRDEDGLPILEKIPGNWTDVVVRNNVFADNETNLIQISGYVNNVTFENNTAILPAVKDTEKIVNSHDFGATGLTGDGWVFRNNIFVSRQKRNLEINASFCSGYDFDTNVFWGFADGYADFIKKENGDSVKNMLFEDPGISLDVVAEKGYASLAAFKASNSKMLKGAVQLEEMNQYDADGQKVTDVNYFGAFGTLQ